MPKQAPLIVLVEDNPADVALIRRAVNELDSSVEIKVLSDGEQALRFVDEQRDGEHRHPCAVLLDLHLPRHDGNAVLRAISRTPALEHVRVAVWTTLASPAERAEAMDLGANLYLMKPNNIDGFWDIASKLIELCHERAVGTAG